MTENSAVNHHLYHLEQTSEICLQKDTAENKLSRSAHQENYITIHPIVLSQHGLTLVFKCISRRHGWCQCDIDQIGILIAPIPHMSPALCTTAYRACNKTRLGPLRGLQLLNLGGEKALRQFINHIPLLICYPTCCIKSRKISMH